MAVTELTACLVALPISCSNVDKPVVARIAFVMNLLGLKTNGVATFSARNQVVPSDRNFPAAHTTAPRRPRKLSILGTRGIPAAHGGFETFAEHLALYLSDQGWQVEVYCQDEAGDGPKTWRGVVLHQIQSPSGSWGSLLFDLKSALHARQRNNLILILGYNTAILAIIHRLRGQTVVFNMDGLEWQRQKWSRAARLWLYMNERLACWLGHSLVADHPAIAAHLATRVSASKVTMIPYGSERADTADDTILKRLDLVPGGYALLIARPEPENSVLEIVSAFSTCQRGIKLAVLGDYRPLDMPYHSKIMQAASEQVVFAGAIYDAPALAALRRHAMFYVHGHQVGGTNPSLVEALGAGCPVLAHDNRFNRWVAGPDALYFANLCDCSARMTDLIQDGAMRDRMAVVSARRFAEAFTWNKVLATYETFLAGANNANRDRPG